MRRASSCWCWSWSPFRYSREYQMAWLTELRQPFGDHRTAGVSGLLERRRVVDPPHLPLLAVLDARRPAPEVALEVEIPHRAHEHGGLVLDDVRARDLQIRVLP